MKYTQDFSNKWFIKTAQFGANKPPTGSAQSANWYKDSQKASLRRWTRDQF
jgi:hypothetical protein